VSRVASGRIKRLEFKPEGGVHLVPVANVTAEVDVQSSSVIIALDGMMLAEVAIIWSTPEEGEDQGGHRHHLQIEPYRTDAEWDQGPTIDIRDMSDPEAYS